MDRWIADQLERPQPGTGRRVAAATVARRLSCLAGLYEYAVVDVGLIDASPTLRGDAIAAALPAFEAAGGDELVLDPTVADLSQVERLADLVL